MGAQSFTNSGWIVRKPRNEYTDKDFSELFRDLQREADEEYGHQEGYSGRINNKYDYTFCGAMTRKQYDRAKRWWGGSVDKAPKFLKDKGFAADWRRADDRDGAVCMVVITDEQRDARVLTKKTIGEKNIVPAAKREQKKYEVEYRDPDWEGYAWDSFRVANATDAWKRIKTELARNPDLEFKNIKYSYTYAKPKIKSAYKNAKEVRVKAFGVARW
jgi:hypothetical protein